MTVCDECGGPLEPGVAHIQHVIPCVVDGCDTDCDCPEVCAYCCTDPDCPTRGEIPGQLTIDEAT